MSREIGCVLADEVGLNLTETAVQLREATVEIGTRLAVLRHCALREPTARTSGHIGLRLGGGAEQGDGEFGDLRGSPAHLYALALKRLGLGGRGTPRA